MSQKGSKYRNTLKDRKLQELDRASLDDKKSDLTKRCKFNFSYFDDSQPAGSRFSDLTESQLRNILNSLKEFSRRSLDDWEKDAPRFVMYHNFPIKSEFTHPQHVPHQACWGRFRLGSKFRLVGFTVPAELDGTSHSSTRRVYDKNTFYIVFIDLDHRFWKTEKK